MVRFLLEAGADQEHKTEEMHTALMEASMDGHVEVARLLLDSGAQVGVRGEGGQGRGDVRERRWIGGGNGENFGDFWKSICGLVISRNFLRFVMIGIFVAICDFQ